MKSNNLVPVGVPQSALIRESPKPMHIRTLYDSSASIRDNSPSLVEPLKGAASEFEANLAANSDNRLSRALFHSEIVEIDGGEMLRPDQWLEHPMAKSYHANGSSTILDRVYYDEIKRLCLRFEEVPDAIQMLMVFTDGRNTGEEKAAKVRERMQRVLELARQCGGILSSRIIVAYIGIGLTEGTHLDTCTVRYNIPREWFKWYPAGEEEVRSIGEDLSKTVSDFSEGSQTRFW